MNKKSMITTVVCFLLTVLLTCIRIRIPVMETVGYLHFGFIAVFAAAFLLDPALAALAGGAGSAVAYLIMGKGTLVLPMLLIVALMAYVTGKIISDGKYFSLRNTLAMLAGGIVMIILSYLVQAVLDNSFQKPLFDMFFVAGQLLIALVVVDVALLVFSRRSKQGPLDRAPLALNKTAWICICAVAVICIASPFAYRYNGLPQITIQQDLDLKSGDIAIQIYELPHKWRYLTGKVYSTDDAYVAENAGYWTIMESQNYATALYGEIMPFSFDIKPKKVTLVVYDYDGGLLKSIPDYKENYIQMPEEYGRYTYVIAGDWGWRGRISYAFNVEVR